METAIQGTMNSEVLPGTNVSVLAPGFTGTFVSVEAGAKTRTRKHPGAVSLEGAASLSSVSVVLSGVIELDAPKIAAGPKVRSAGKGAPRLIVKARPEQDYAMLHTDEVGRKRWIFPEKGTGTSKAATSVFMLPETAPIPRSLAKESRDDSKRGLVTSTMRRLVTIVTWVASPLIKTAAQKIALAWEGEKRPYGLWQVAADAQLVAPDWSQFDAAPALLMIHGTFSTPVAGFGSLMENDEFAALHARYQGRVLALAHPSLSSSPEANVDWLLGQLPGNTKWTGTLDIICHSRGGLLARDLAARAALGDAPRVDRVCQVGTPNLGTVLADPKRWVNFLDAYTNCLTFLPDTAATIILEGLLCVVKIIGTGAADGLPGLVAMNPNGPWIKAIATRGSGDVRWFTIGTNYEPAGDFAKGFIDRVGGKVADIAVDAFFESNNDMVVPSVGCHAPGVKPIDSLALDDGLTTHTSYFQSKEVRQALMRWLA